MSFAYCSISQEAGKPGKQWVNFPEVPLTCSSKVVHVYWEGPEMFAERCVISVIFHTATNLADLILATSLAVVGGSTDDKTIALPDIAAAFVMLPDPRSAHATRLADWLVTPSWLMIGMLVIAVVGGIAPSVSDGHKMWMLVNECHPCA